MAATPSSSFIDLTPLLHQELADDATARHTTHPSSTPPDSDEVHDHDDDDDDDTSVADGEGGNNHDGKSTLSRDDDSLHLRTQFLRRVAHDIASPTGVMMTVIDELANDSKRPELVAMARRGLKRLLRLSEQLALVADLEGGPVAPDASPEDVRVIAKDALDAAVTIDGRRDVVTALDVPDEKLMAHIDRRLVCSMLREVVGNALRLASSRVEVSVERVADTVVVRVQDDGPGFPGNIAMTVGERFTADSSARGLGLSLSMAKEVLTAHGGALQFGTSTLAPGRRGVRGAAVMLSFPLR